MTMKKRKKRPMQVFRPPTNNENKFEKFLNKYTIALIFSGVFVLIFSVSLYLFIDHNAIRNAIAENPRTTSAEVIEIAMGKGVNFADYTFLVNGKKYTGTTFYSYQGKIGDLICIEHLIDNPEVNIYCEEKSSENFFDDVLLNTIKIMGIMIGTYLIMRIFRKNKGN